MDYITDSNQATAIAVELSRQTVLGLDIETAPLAQFENDPRAGLCPYKSKPRLISVASQNGAVTVFDMAQMDPSVLAPLARAPWVAHNATFEYGHLTHHGYTFTDVLHDSILMGRLVYHKRLSLAELAQKALDQPLDKSLQTSDWGGELSREQIEYAGRDARASLQIANKLLKQIELAGQRPLYTLYRRCVPVVGQQMLDGIYFDWTGHDAWQIRWLAEKERLKAELDELMPGVNPRSTKQVAAWFNDNLPKSILRRWPRTGKGALSSSAESLAQFAHLPIVQPLLRFKAAATLLSTFGAGYAKFRHPVTDRLHADYLIVETAGGRFACRRPNLQNPPRQKGFRRLFPAEPGRVLVTADFGQIELRVAALLAQDTRMMGAYERGEDLHRLTAAAVASVDLTSVTADQRQAAKAINFGNLYQQRPSGLSQYALSSYGVEMRVDQAAAAQAAFFRTYPQLYRWQRQQILQARQWRKVRSVLGLVRDFNYRCGYLAAEACNHTIQASAGEVLLSSLARLPDALSDLDAKLVNHVHDEIVLSVAREDQTPAATTLERVMVHGFLDVFPNAESMLRGLVKAKSGMNWAETK